VYHRHVIEDRQVYFFDFLIFFWEPKKFNFPPF
jgi:hypothetical protein